MKENMEIVLGVLREHESIEYHFSVTVTRNAGGNITAIVNEDTRERFWTRRYGGLELDYTGYLKYAQGEEIDLEDDELEKVKQELDAAE